LELVKRFADTKLRCFPVDDDVPLEGVVRGLWRDAVVEKDAAGRDRINRVTYEVAVLEALREQLRCKEIWVVGANRYRNPDEDLPADFEGKRDEYYKALDLPLEAERFIGQLQDEMRGALHALDAGLQNNPDVRIGPKRGGWITLTPLAAQPDPPQLKAFKAELNATWPMTELLDMIKQTDLRLGFTNALKSPTAYETLERSVLQPRLLLCLRGMGTNAGLQRMASIDSGVTARDLAYVRRRYISADTLRRAIAIVANGTCRHEIQPFGAPAPPPARPIPNTTARGDQNLTTQWHVRYGGRGVMIYWHVERNSLCIHSQLKSPSSSEVAAMIEGVIHHCTEMEVDRQYVDSHGQRTVAFAFCWLLGFLLLPRLKAIEMPLDKVQKMLKVVREPISLETPMGDEEQSSLGDLVEDELTPSPVEAAIRGNLGELTIKVLATLTPREEQILRMRFGIGQKTDCTLEEVGKLFAVTRERIRQIEAKALRKLRQTGRSRKLEGFMERE
jgi:RNA polymerase sigma factor (sigma-70 family)